MDIRRSAGGAPVISSPPMCTRPLVTSSRPAIMRKVVDFPHPDGPRRTTKLPSSTSNEMSRTATVAPQVLVTRTSSMAAIGPLEHPALRHDSNTEVS